MAIATFLGWVYPAFLGTHIWPVHFIENYYSLTVHELSGWQALRLQPKVKFEFGILLKVRVNYN